MFWCFTFRRWHFPAFLCSLKGQKLTFHCHESWDPHRIICLRKLGTEEVHCVPQDQPSDAGNTAEFPWRAHPAVPNAPKIMYKVSDELKKQSKGHTQPCAMNQHGSHTSQAGPLHLGKSTFMLTSRLDWISLQVHSEEPTALLVTAKAGGSKIAERENSLGLGLLFSFW